MTIERHIEELRAELSSVVDPAERRKIAAELELAQAELRARLAGMTVLTHVKPPF
jgi:hypothetical protein